MKEVYEKGLPLLLSVAFAIQEIKWGEWKLSYVIVILLCLYGVIFVLMAEKRQLILLAGLILTGAVILGIYWRAGSGNTYARILLSTLPLQGAFCVLIMKNIYSKSIFSFLSLIALIILRLWYVPVSVFLVYLILFCVVLSVSELVHVVYYSEELRSGHTLGLVPAFALLFILLFAIPKKDTPFDWSFVVNPVVHFFDSTSKLVENVKDYWEESDDFFCYQPNNGAAKLGGDVHSTNRVLLKVRANLMNGHTVYLNGSVYDDYTGEGWKKKSVKLKGDTEEYKVARNELEAAFRKEAWDKVKDESIVRESVMDIQYGRIRTKTLFYPEYLKDISWKAWNTNLILDTPNLFFNKVRTRGYEYKVFFKDINTSSRYIQSYLRTLDSFQTKDKQLEQRANTIKEDYARLPDTLPDSVRNIANEITSGSDNTFDKMQSICNYLNDFKYTKKVNKVPKGKDFVENFLLGSKKGYCTYFASAAAVLGRCAGIPTRYVEGMILSKDCKKENNYYLLDGSRMHAWCEAYFEGFGWMVFEATPGYQDKKVVWEKTEGENYYQKEPVKATVKPDEAIKEEHLVLSSKKAGKVPLAVIPLIVILIIFLVITIKCLWNKNKKRSENEYCRYLISQSLFYVRKMGVYRNEWETLSELEERVMQEGILETKQTKESFRQAMKLYLKLCYSSSYLDKDEVKRLKDNVSNLKLEYKSQKGKIRYCVAILEETLLID